MAQALKEEKISLKATTWAFNQEDFEVDPHGNLVIPEEFHDLLKKDHNIQLLQISSSRERKRLLVSTYRGDGTHNKDAIYLASGETLVILGNGRYERLSDLI